MIARILLSLMLMLGASMQAPAQSADAMTLAYRFSPGSEGQDQMRASGEFKIIGGGKSVPVAFDMAATTTRHVDAVDASGAATVTYRPTSTILKLSGAGKRIFSIQDRDGVTTLVDGVPAEPQGKAPGEIVLKIGRDGRILDAKGSGEQATENMLRALTASSVPFPEKAIVVGDAWSGETRFSPPADARLPDVGAKVTHLLRSLRRDDGRLVATVVTTSERTSSGATATADGSNRVFVSQVARFNAETGEMIDTIGEIEFDLRLDNNDGAPGRLTGKLHIAVESAPYATPKPAPPPAPAPERVDELPAQQGIDEPPQERDAARAKSPPRRFAGVYRAVSESEWGLTVHLRADGRAILIRETWAPGRYKRRVAKRFEGAWSAGANDQLMLTYDGVSETVQFNDRMSFGEFGQQGAAPGFKGLSRDATAKAVIGQTSLWRADALDRLFRPSPAPARIREVSRSPGSAELGADHDNRSLSGGSILRFYGSPSAAACRSDCARNDTCQGYTWVKPGGYKAGDGPVCYLMRSYDSAKPHDCCIAATRGPFPHP